MMQAVRAIARSGVAIILIEHVMRFLVQLSSRVMIMHHGERIYEGPPDGLARDRTVGRQKHRPVMSEEARLELVASLKPVDKAILGHEDERTTRRFYDKGKRSDSPRAAAKMHELFGGQ
mgnify:CR=1 FL=1